MKIEINNLTKTYGKTIALYKINLTIEPNKIYGLLGRNGAGKSTLLNLITNKIYPTEGEILINHENVCDNGNVLNDIYHMVERKLNPDGMKVIDVFKWTKEFYPDFDTQYAYNLAKKFSLKLDKKVKALSTGYHTILKDIVALATNPKILLLDEPVLGLDANFRDLFYKELIANFSEHPKTIVVSTHLIEEVASIIEEVIIIKEGKILLQDSVSNLLSKSYTISGVATQVDQYIENKNYVGIETLGKFKKATVLEDVQSINHELIKKLDLEVAKAELQKLFISLTN